METSKEEGLANKYFAFQAKAIELEGGFIELEVEKEKASFVEKNIKHFNQSTPGQKISFFEDMKESPLLVNGQTFIESYSLEFSSIKELDLDFMREIVVEKNIYDNGNNDKYYTNNNKGIAFTKEQQIDVKKLSNSDLIEQYEKAIKDQKFIIKLYKNRTRFARLGIKGTGSTLGVVRNSHREAALAGQISTAGRFILKYKASLVKKIKESITGIEELITEIQKEAAAREQPKKAVAREQPTQEEIAATKLQALFRGRKVRKALEHPRGVPEKHKKIIKRAKAKKTLERQDLRSKPKRKLRSKAFELAEKMEKAFADPKKISDEERIRMNFRLVPRINNNVIDRMLAKRKEQLAEISEASRFTDEALLKDLYSEVLSDLFIESAEKLLTIRGRSEIDSEAFEQARGNISKLKILYKKVFEADTRPDGNRRNTSGDFANNIISPFTSSMPEIEDHVSESGQVLKERGEHTIEYNVKRFLGNLKVLDRGEVDQLVERRMKGLKRVGIESVEYNEVLKDLFVEIMCDAVIEHYEGKLTKEERKEIADDPTLTKTFNKARNNPTELLAFYQEVFADNKQVKVNMSFLKGAIKEGPTKMLDVLVNHTSTTSDLLLTGQQFSIEKALERERRSPAPTVTPFRKLQGKITRGD